MIRINLIKEEGKGRAEMKMYLVLYVLSVIMVTSALLYLSSFYAAELRDLEDKVAKMQSEKKKLTAKTKDIQKIEANKESLHQKLLIIATLKKSKTGPVQVLDRINQSLPEKAWLVGIAENDAEHMTLRGYAFDNESVSEFAHDLGLSEFFPEVKIVEVTQEDYKDIKVSKFDLNVKVRFEGKPLIDEPASTEDPDGDKMAPPGMPPSPK